MQRITAIIRLVHWFCKQVNFDEILIAVNMYLEIIQGKRTTIPLRSDRNEKYPNYRQYVVDPVAPLTETPVKNVHAKADFKQLFTPYRDYTFKELTPIHRRKNFFCRHFISATGVRTPERLFIGGKALTATPFIHVETNAAPAF